MEISGKAKKGKHKSKQAPAAEPIEAGQAATLPEAPPAGAEGAPQVGSNLRRLRMARGLSLETLAKASGVSRAMLSQVELGQSTPTINLLWKIAVAMGLPFSAFLPAGSASDDVCVLRADRAKRLTSHDGRFSSRALFPADRPRRVEFYELRLAARGLEEADPHPPGTVENLLVNAGSVEIRVGEVTHELETGDAIQFRADTAHSYRNRGSVEAVMCLVMSYTETIGAAPGWSV